MFSSFIGGLLTSFVRQLFISLVIPPVCHQIVVSFSFDDKERSVDEDDDEINSTSQLLPNSPYKERDLENGQGLRFAAYRAAWKKCLNKIKVWKYPTRRWICMLCDLSISTGSYWRTTWSICEVSCGRDQVLVPQHPAWSTLPWTPSRLYNQWIFPHTWFILIPFFVFLQILPSVPCTWTMSRPNWKT